MSELLGELLGDFQKPWEFPVTVPTRRDLDSAEIVNQGIAMLQTEGTTSAARFLEANHIALDIVTRVLLHPLMRRKVERAI